MAGLILKELKLRNLVKRILIVVPGHLKDQWRRELQIFYLKKLGVYYSGEGPIQNWPRHFTLPVKV